MTTYRTGIIFSLLLGIAGCSGVDVRPDNQGASRTSATNCIGDLEFAAAFLLDNDAGIKAAGWETYPQKVTDVLNRARLLQLTSNRLPNVWT